VAGKLIHEILPVGMLQCNCSILGDPETREALVVDPGDEVERILEVIRRHGLTVRAIVSTHAHIDHVGGLRKLQQVTGAPVLMHGDDLDLYRHLDLQAAWLGTRPPDAAQIDTLLREGDTLRWGRFSANVLHTPGHTPGSVSLYMPAEKDVVAGEATEKHVVAATARQSGQLLAGDTLFAGSIGRTDLWGGSMPQILRSIHSKLLVLPDDTLVYPGHGESTTIGRERESNPFLELAEGNLGN
jgi:glyoxylase-like metal-dependent hydrolase (beta-lactamase superfamily II)